MQQARPEFTNLVRYRSNDREHREEGSPAFFVALAEIVRTSDSRHYFRIGTTIMRNQLAVDFGTSNTTAAYLQSGKVKTISFPPEPSVLSFPTVLFFLEPEFKLGVPPIYVGRLAEQRYEAPGMQGRMISALKKYLPDGAFQGTFVFNRTYAVSDLLDFIISFVKQRAELQSGLTFSRVILGKPVRFSPTGATGDEELAIGRLREAARRCGFEEVAFLDEPVAAAISAWKNELIAGITLICDYGGGTSDFSLLTPDRKHLRLVGSAGVNVGGTNLDQKLVEKLLAPALGSETLFRSLTGDWLPVPKSYYTQLTWHQLPFLSARKVRQQLEEIARKSSDPDKIQTFLSIIEAGAGFRLLRSVESLKKQLSNDEIATLRVSLGDHSLDEAVSRKDFESWIRPELLELDDCVDSLLKSTRCRPSQISNIVLTGGSASVPAIQVQLRNRFPHAKIVEHALTHGVVGGLALSEAAIIKT